MPLAGEQRTCFWDLDNGLVPPHYLGPSFVIPAQGSCRWFEFNSLITFFLMLRLHWVSNMQFVRSRKFPYSGGWEILPSLVACSLASISK